MKKEGTNSITYSISNTKGVQSPMFMFNTLYDTDFGIINLIKKSYINDERINQDFYTKNNTIRKMVLSLYNRNKKNPLYLILKDNYSDQAKSLYDELIKTHYSDILDCSCYTGLYYLARALKISQDISSYIFCLNDDEVNIISKEESLKGIMIITKKNILSHISEINQFYFKSLYDDKYTELLSESLIQKSIYIEDYSFNFDKENKIIIDDYVNNLIKNRCFFNYINAYDINKLIDKGEISNGNRENSQ